MVDEQLITASNQLEGYRITKAFGYCAWYNGEIAKPLWKYCRRIANIIWRNNFNLC